MKRIYLLLIIIIINNSLSYGYDDGSIPSFGPTISTQINYVGLDSLDYDYANRP